MRRGFGSAGERRIHDQQAGAFVTRHVGELLGLALPEQGRRPNRSNPERPRRDDVDADCFGEPLRFLDAGLGRAPRTLARKLRHRDDRALAASDVDRTIAVERVQEAVPCSSPSSPLPSLSGCAACNVEIACL